MASLNDLYSYAPDIYMAQAFPETSAYRPDLPRPMRGLDRRDFGQRHDIVSGAKGYGWLGPMQSASGAPMTEYSTTNEPDRYGRLPVSAMNAGRNFPQVVPTLNAQEMNYLLSEPRGLPPVPTQQRAMDDAVYRKALEWARMRQAYGLSPFVD